MTEPTPEPNVSQPPVAEQPAADPIEAKLAELSEPFVAPIQGSNPAGENARFDERHEAIRNQVDKLGRPEAEELDWGLIEEAGRALLTEKSKDYLIASYFGVAAYVRTGPRGLIEGLCALSALLEHYWDNGFPPPDRLRARVNAIDWFVDRVGAFGDRAPKTVQQDDLQMLSRAAKRFQGLVLDRFGEEIPNIYGLKETLERIELSIVGQSDGQPHAQDGQPGAPSAADPSPAPSSAATSLGPAPPEGGAPVAPQPAGGSPEAKLAALAQAFTDPIPGGSRAGENARHDEKHEAIRNEVDKLGKPTAEEVDWELVREVGGALLTSKSKDFLIASYFAVASYVRGGVEGLVTGLAALSALLRNYWDDGYPPVARIRARANALDWFIDRVESLGDLAPKSVKAGDLELLGFAAKQLEELVLERFEDESPNVHRLKEILQQIELAVAKQAPAQPVAPTQSPSPGPARTQPEAPTQGQPTPVAAVQLATPTAQLTDPAQVNKFLRELGESVHKASRALFKASKEDPLAYRLCRLGLYVSFQEAPPATNGNQTMVPPPTPDREAHLNALLSARNWPVLLDEAESGLASARLWLDQHRYVALALAGLGHEKAKETVVAETAALIRRLPELPELAFSDGFPFASPATRDWLGSLSPSATESTGLAVTDAAEHGAFEEGLAEAHKLAVGGKLGEAVEKLGRVIDSRATSGRDRFRAKLAMANACSRAGSAALAEGILASLSEEIRQFRLQEWEPKMAEACYRARYEALAAMTGESAKSRDELVDIYRQLCGVAPAAALKLGKPPG